MVCLLCSVSLADDWSRFRGPNGSGILETEGLPTTFGPDTQLAWKTEVPFGSSSPVIFAGHVFLTAADEDALIVVCLDEVSGEVLWRKEILRARQDETFKMSDSAIPTPTADADGVYAFFPEFGLVAYDHQGRLRWSHALEPFVSFYGMASSPVLTDEALILLCDQQKGSYLLAVDKASGKVRWRQDRARIECWTTPVLWPAAEPTQLLVFGSFFVDGYDLESGEHQWEVGGFGYTPVPSPTLGDSVLYTCVPYHAEHPLPGFEDLAKAMDQNKDGLLSKAEVQGELGEHFGWADGNQDEQIDAAEWKFVNDGMSSKDFGLVALDLKADGPATERWRFKKSLPSIASPLLYQGVLYLVKHGGIVTALNPENGEELKRERLGTTGDCFPSPVASDDKIFVATSSGEVAVLEAGADWKVLAKNDIGEEIIATPAIGSGRLIIRTKQSLMCFGAASGQ